MWILWLYLLNTFFLLILAVREARRPAKALSWLIICLLLPVFGFGLYLTTSKPLLRQKKLIHRQSDMESVLDSFSRSVSVIAHALQPLTVNGIRTGRIQVFSNGMDTFEKMIECIQNAKRTIDLEYFLFREDQIGRRITSLLIERAEAGVQVRFVRDAWGSRHFPRRQIIRMMKAGVECRAMFPLRFPWIMTNWYYRDHCKIAVIDQKEAFTGGINIGFEYTGMKPNVGFWRDTHVQISGESAIDLQLVFDEHWKDASPEPMDKRTRRDIKTGTKPIKGSRQHSANIITTGRVRSGGSGEWSSQLGTLEGTIQRTDSIPKAYVQTLESNPGIPTQTIRQAYFICLAQATQTIDITTPYFAPDADIIMAIKTAVLRGVRVRLLVPLHSDQRIMDLASRTYFGELLEAGVHIYLYNKGNLHAKVMIIDGTIAEIGTANYDLRSFRLEYNVCEIIYSTDVALELTNQFERDLTESSILSIEDLLQRSLSRRILEQGARLLSPLL